MTWMVASNAIRPLYAPSDDSADRSPRLRQQVVRPARSSSVHAYNAASAGVGNGMAPRPLRIDSTHWANGLASSAALESSSATTTSAETMTWGAASAADGWKVWRYAAIESRTAAGATW